ncbi:bifunctional UDP-sugar hydrolase/5'-nucleotidase periplasmic [Actinobacillus indolicus]|nr:bifunctional UDP-sugar hydrolase/5'-nucleotidase periplasmic [Actinobacillus indolicus]VTU08467.1 bifunctional UDP-sugar hydrolase/5'-nucleotidase periplasmic [Actinobacillus indolicus]
MKFNKTLLSLALVSSTAMAYETDKTYKFTVLHLNDTHGHFWKNDKDEYGFAAQKTAIENIRKEVAEKGGEVLLVHAGDFNTGVPESDMQNAKPDIEGLNMLGVDVAVLGNHEFDYPLQILDMQEKWAKFPFISANVINKKTNKHLVKPYVTFDKSGLKIAVLGLTTEDTAKLGNPDVTDNVTFNDPIKTAKATLAEVNSQEKPDVRIALTHMGYYYDAQHGMNAPGDVTLARTLDKGAFDVIVGGHTHDTVCVDEKGVFKAKYTPGEECKPDFQNGTWIVQAGEWGKFLGRADFEFKNGETKLVKYELIPINLKQKIKLEDGKSEYKLYQAEIPENKAVFDHLKKYQDEGDKLLGVKVGEVKGGKLEGDRKVIRFHQTNLGRLIAQSQMERVKADIGIMNSGGIRASINEGDVTYKDILTVQPFGNMIATVDLTGQELLDYLNVVALKDVDMGAYPQFAGVSMVVDRTAKQVSEVKIGGNPLDLNKKYKVSVPDYCAAGGDGYPILKKHPSYVNTGFIDAEMLKKYFEENSPIDASKYDPKNDVIFK